MPTANQKIDRTQLCIAIASTTARPKKSTNTVSPTNLILITCPATTAVTHKTNSSPSAEPKLESVHRIRNDCRERLFLSPDV